MTIASHGNGFAKMQDERKLVAEDVLLIYIKGQEHAEAIVEYYSAVRNVPAQNALSVAISWNRTDNVLSQTDTELLLGAITTYIRSNQNIRAICLCGEWPTRIPNNFTQGGLNAGLITAVNKPFHTDILGVVDLLAGSLSGISNIPLSREMTAPYRYMDNKYRSVYWRPPQTSNYRYNMWKPNTNYIAGNSYVMTQTLFPFTVINQYPVTTSSLALLCTVSGVSGNTEPTINVKDDTVIDGEVTWVCSSPREDFFIPAAYRHPKDYYNAVKASTNGEPGWEIMLTYPVTILDAPNVEDTDIYNTSKLDIVKRMIDDSIAVEAKNLREFPGKVLVSPGAGIVPQSDAYLELQDHGHTLDNVYYEALNSDQSSIYGSTNLPTTPKYANGNTSLLPTRPLSGFNKISNVFFAAIGGLSYYSETKIPFTRNELEYAQGAITLWGQSCGALPDVRLSIDYFNTIRDIDPTVNANGVLQNALNTKANLYYLSGALNSVVRGVNFQYSGLATTAQIQVTALNTIELFEDGISVLALTVAEGTVNTHVETLLDATLPADWTIGFTCQFVESRAARALLNGACVAIGAPHEPTTAAAPLATNLIDGLLSGHCLAETVVTTLTSGGRLGSESNPRALVYGDPLYRPFHSRNLI